MRIIGGKWRGRKLHTPTKGLVPTKIRPTLSKVREAMFAILGDQVTEARVLDLCAGTGALGIEALSRRAQHCTFIDHSRSAINLVNKNLCHLEAREAATLLKMPLSEAFKKLQTSFEIIFCDPPYVKQADQPATLLLAALTHMGKSDLLTQGGRCLIQSDPRVSLAAEQGSLVKIQQKDYGDTVLHIYTR